MKLHKINIEDERSLDFIYKINKEMALLTAKNDLKVFESALQDGYITEDRLVGVQEEVEKLKSNLDRIQYIMYLFELPKRKAKKAKFIAANEELEKYFAEHKVNLKSITDENTSTLTGLRAEIKKLKEEE